MLTPPTRILIDLKPALDGYAGIPQETRLLFSELRQEPNLSVKGLIQHGSRNLRPALTPALEKMSPARRTIQNSRFIASLDERYFCNVWEQGIYEFNQRISDSLLSVKSLLGARIPRSRFDAHEFSDFIWRTLFDKSVFVDRMQDLTQDEYWVISFSRKQFHNAGLRSLTWGSRAYYPVIDSRQFDFFIAQTPFPARLTKKTRMVVRYHDAVPILFPHTVSQKTFHLLSHYHALLSNIRSGALFSCVSESTRNDLVRIFPEAEPLSSVIHNMVSDAYYFEEDSQRSMVPELVRNRLAGDLSVEGTNSRNLELDKFDYLLMVSTIEPRKNHKLLIRAWETLKRTIYPELKLILVGSWGWDFKSIQEEMRPWRIRGELFLLQDVPAEELRVLYRHAVATICPSLAEGFDYSGVEAMRCGCPVVASDIPVHREIYRDASLYINPYSYSDAAAAIAKLSESDAYELRLNLIERGLKVANEYLPERILPQWADFFSRSQQAK